MKRHGRERQGPHARHIKISLVEERGSAQTQGHTLPAVRDELADALRIERCKKARLQQNGYPARSRQPAINMESLVLLMVCAPVVTPTALRTASRIFGE